MLPTSLPTFVFIPKVLRKKPGIQIAPVQNKLAILILNAMFSTFVSRSVTIKAKKKFFFFSKNEPM